MEDIAAFFGLSFPCAARKMWGGVRILPRKEIRTQGEPACEFLKKICFGHDYFLHMAAKYANFWDASLSVPTE